MTQSKNIYLQSLRGLAIAVVVLIHVLPTSDLTLFIRPLLNWGVALFLFLSGMLSPESKFTARGGVVRKRLVKTLVPYLVWSVAYWAALGSGSLLGLGKGLLTGSCAPQLYYLVVYAQLVVLTPWLYRVLRSHRALVYLVTPAVLVLREVLGAFGMSVPHLGAFFATWLIYYVLGLEWKRIAPRIKRVALPKLALAFVVCLAFQYGSGFAWNAYGCFDIATTQLKVTSMATAVLVILLFMRVAEFERNPLRGRGMISRLGDVSFGVYLCHIAVLVAARKVFALLGLTAFGWSFALWIVVLAVSALVVLLGQRMLPSRALSVIGFV